MSTAVKEKKPFLPQRKPQIQAGGVVARVGGGVPVLQGGGVIVGGEPRVHLLPLEVTERKKARLVKRRLLIGLVATVVVVAGAYGFETFTLASAQNALADANQQTAVLTSQQGKYGEVTKVKSDIAAIQGAQTSATANEILWAPYIQSFEATLPAGSSISTIGVGMSTDTAATNPLDGPHIASLNATLSMVQGTIPAWLNSLPKLKGFVSATPDSVSAISSGLYTVVITIDIDQDALSHRFGNGVTSK
jgi:hypothetical protein